MEESMSLKSLLPSSASGNGTVPSTSADTPPATSRPAKGVDRQGESVGLTLRVAKTSSAWASQILVVGTPSNDRVIPLHAHCRTVPLFIRLVLY